MADRGIIFSAPMVRALLAGRKTQTRRLLTGGPPGEGWHCDRADTPSGYRFVAEGGSPSLPCKVPHAVGDRLYGREAAAYVGTVDPQWVIYRASGYEAECERHGFDDPPAESEIRWTPSIHMPRWASRMTLLVRKVRVQRLQDISAEDALAEGHSTDWSLSQDRQVHLDAARDWFMDLWNSLHTKPGERWGDNPWIYALTFEVVRENIDRISA